MKLLKVFCLLFLMYSVGSGAANMDITASFSPSLEHPQNNKFVNTTPISGYCASFSEQCDGVQTFSIALPLSAQIITGLIEANATPRNSMYFKMPNMWREIPVRHEQTGKTFNLKFRVSAFSSKYAKIENKAEWTSGSFVYAPPPCSYSGVGVSDGNYYLFMWKYNPTNADIACSKISKIDRTEITDIFDMSIGYELITPDPIKMESGRYYGTLSLSSGPGGDFDFGDIFQVSDSMVNFNFELTVNHELKITPVNNARSVELQPCGKGQLCTPDEGKMNWEKWLVTQVTPQAMTGHSEFDIGSSGSFLVYLQCEHTMGTGCGIKGDKSQQIVPVQTMLNLPSNIRHADGSMVSRDSLVNYRDETKVYYTEQYSTNARGSIDFQVEQKDIDTMLKVRPDEYRGIVTAIFDPQIY